MTVPSLNNLGIEPNVNIVATNRNYLEIGELIQEINKLGKARITVSEFRNNINNCKDLALKDFHRKHLRSNLIRIQEESQISNKVYSCLMDEYTGARIRAKERKLCEAGRLSMLIMPDGTFFYCDQLIGNNNFSFGNVCYQSIRDAWLSDELNGIQRKFTENSDNSHCSSCASKQYCLERGVCYSESILRYASYCDKQCIECNINCSHTVD